jgi:hypothetical protein
MPLFHNRQPIPEKDPGPSPKVKRENKERKADRRETRVRDRGFDMNRKPFEEGQ